MNIKNDGSVTYVGDGQTWGKEIYYSHRSKRWLIVAVDPFVKWPIIYAQRLTVVTSSRADNEDLNQACVACDLEEGFWVLASDRDEELLPPDGVRIVWDSIDNAKEVVR